MLGLPLVSIIIPVYNGSNFLSEAIDSALAQTYSNIEIIVVNDGSNDNGKTEAIARSYGEKIRYIEKENGGVSSALNVGIANMRGEYFSWLSHDDKYAPEKIASQVQILSRHGDPSLIALCADRHIDVDSKLLDKRAKQRFTHEAVVCWQDVVMSLLEQGTLNGCALLIPRHIFDQCGGFDTELRFNQDAKMWFGIFLNKNRLVYQSDVMVYNRLHSAQVTHTRKDLYHSDCEKMSRTLLPRLIAESDDTYDFFYAYAKSNAKYHNKAVVDMCMQGENRKRLSARKRMNVQLVRLYGAIRPSIRQVYYLLFKGILVKSK